MLSGTSAGLLEAAFSEELVKDVSTHIHLLNPNCIPGITQTTAHGELLSVVPGPCN